MESNIKKIGVIGSGQMGGGIAHVAALSGYEVMLFDVNEEALLKSKEQIEKNLHRQVEKNKITYSQAKEAIEKVFTTSKIEGLKDVDFVIEAASENIEVKQSIFKSLGEVLRPEVVAGAFGLFSVDTIKESYFAEQLAVTVLPNKWLEKVRHQQEGTFQCTELVSGQPCNQTFDSPHL